MDRYDEFRKCGYIVIKNALDQDEVYNLRKLAAELCDKKSEETVSNTAQDRQLYAQAFAANPELVNPLFKKNIVDEIKAVLGDDYISFADFSLNDNCHSPIWHADSQSHGFSTQYVYNSSYNIAKLGLYLQENDGVYGGQLDIIPGSHLPTFLGVNSPITFERRYGKVSILQLLAMKIRNVFLKRISINVGAGDILLFHGLLQHRASQPDWNKVNQIDGFGVENPPGDKRKFMLQWEVSQNNEFAPVYATHQTKRGEVMGHGEFYESNQYSFEQYSQSTRAIIESNGVNFKLYKDLCISTEANNLKSADGTPIVFFYKG